MARAKAVIRQPKNKDRFAENLQKVVPTIKPRLPYKDDEDVPRKKTLDPLSENLGQTMYIFKARFQWLKREWFGVKYSLDVERYYEGLNLCVDIKHGDEELPYTELKKELCEQNGKRYFYLRSGEDVENMLNSLRGH